VASRLEVVAAGLASAGSPVEYLACALSRRDEVAFCVREAPSEQSAETVCRRAGIRLDRITEGLYSAAAAAGPTARSSEAERDGFDS
jgi:hypothetical protein